MSVGCRRRIDGFCLYALHEGLAYWDAVLKL